MMNDGQRRLTGGLKAEREPVQHSLGQMDPKITVLNI